jgi:hypothetical protein
MYQPGKAKGDTANMKSPNAAKENQFPKALAGSGARSRKNRYQEVPFSSHQGQDGGIAGASG